MQLFRQLCRLGNKSMSHEEPTVEEAAYGAVIERSNKALGKLKNGHGKSETCPAHESLAQAIVCIGEMTIPVYRHVVTRYPDSGTGTSIKTKWFTATGVAAMLPIAFIVITAIVCYTLIKLYGV